MKKHTALKNLPALIVTFMALFTSPAFAGTADKDFWLTTGLNWSSMNSNISSDKCNSNAFAFVACFRAVALPIEAKQEMLIPTALLGDFKIKSVTHTYGPFSAVSFAKDPFETEPENVGYAMKLAYRKKEIAVLQKIFGAKNATQLIDWNATLASVGQSYVPSDKNEARVTGEAINEYLSAMFDPHTHITPTAETNSMEEDPDSEWVGIGITMAIVKGKVVIFSISPGGPALKAGILRNDVIVSVDDHSTENVSLDDYDKISAMIRGIEGTKVQIGILRGTSKLQFNIVRAPIVSANVEARLVDDSDKRLGYIKFGSFMDDKGCAKIGDDIGKLLAKGAKGIVLDLRGNGGGLVDQALCLGGLFVGQKIITVERALPGKFLDKGSGQVVQNMMGSAPAKFPNLPLVILQDSGSASASEIFAGAMQDYRAAWIVGDTSFGKGSVQFGVEMNKNKALMFFETTARFYQPSGRTNQSVGIAPDFKVVQKSDSKNDEVLAVREADLYTNALPPIGKAWVQTRSEEVAKITACVKQKGTASQVYEREKNTALGPDFQLYSAEDILACSIR